MGFYVPGIAFNIIHRAISEKWSKKGELLSASIFFQDRPFLLWRYGTKSNVHLERNYPVKAVDTYSYKLSVMFESILRILFVLTFILTMGIATSQIYLMQKFNKEIMLPKLLKR